MKQICLLLVCLVMNHLLLLSQTVPVSFDLSHWDTTGSVVSVEQYMGKQSLLLTSGFIVAKDAEFLDGVIEVDIKVEKERYFPGICFRLLDKANYENFYVRPHQSGNPDATQYTPVFNGLAGWQLYHGEGYSAAFPYKFDAWHHIKIDVHGRQAEIYIDDMQKPLIKVTELKRDWKAGKLALSGGGAPVHFANLQYTPKKLPAPPAFTIPANGTNGLITQWQVSNTVARKFFASSMTLTADMKRQLTFTTQRTEPSGSLNLAKFGAIGENNNVMIAKITIESASEQIKKFLFGFSDYCMVFLNDQPLYTGEDNFMSRDYRFLGTVGFFDAVYLPLKKGTNELWIAVSEDFGGWGVKGMFSNMEGITLK